MIYVLTVLGAVLVVAIVVVMVHLCKVPQSKGVVAELEPARAHGEGEMSMTAAGFATQRVADSDECELRHLVMRGSVAELLRTARLFRTLLSLHTNELAQRHVASAVETEVVSLCGRGINEALLDYDNDLPRSLLTGARRLYDMVLLQMSLNLRVRRGRGDRLAQQLMSERQKRDSFPWDMVGNKSFPTDGLPELIADICEKLNSLPTWLNNPADMDTESAFYVLARTREKLVQLEQSLNPAMPS